MVSIWQSVVRTTRPPRRTLAGLNLAQYPSVLVECGNMKNPVDSALMESPDGRQKYADAVVKGIEGFLGGQAAAR